MSNPLSVSLRAVAHTSPVKLVAFAVLFVSLSAIVPWTIYQELDGDLSVVWTSLLAPRLIIAALSLLILYYLSDALRLWFTLRALGETLPLPNMSPLVFINLLVSNITPLATGGGLVQIWYLHRLGIRIGVATAATTLRTLLASLMIFIPAPLLLLSLDPLETSDIARNWTQWLGIFALLYLGFFLTLLWRIRYIITATIFFLAGMRRVRLIGAQRCLRWQHNAKRELIRFNRSFRSFLKGNPQDIALALLSTATFLLSLFSFPALLMWHLGYEINYLLVVGVMLVNTFIMYFAPTPGAAGIAEGAFALFFASLLSSADLILVMLGWRFLTVHLGMLIGVPVTLHALLQRGNNYA